MLLYVLVITNNKCYAYIKCVLLMENKDIGLNHLTVMNYHFIGGFHTGQIIILSYSTQGTKICNQ